MPSFTVRKHNDPDRWETDHDDTRISAREAVMSCHAHSLGDFDDLHYEDRYGHLVAETPSRVECGRFYVDLDPAPRRLLDRLPLGVLR